MFVTNEIFKEFVFFLLLLGYDNSFAVKYHDKFDNWQLFSVEKNSKNYCYVISAPINKKFSLKRNKCYFIVTRIDGRKYEINLSVEDKIYKKSFVILDDVLFELLNEDEMSWAKNSSDDQKIVAKMKLMKKMQVGWYVSEKERKMMEYSLEGFNQAMEKMNTECR